jgi:hypothetical protein
MRINGEPHSAVAGILARIETEGSTKALRQQLGKAWARMEDGSQPHTGESLLAAANALGVDVSALWQAAGLSTPGFSSEDAILTDRRLNGGGRQTVLVVYRSLLRDIPDDED